MLANLDGSLRVIDLYFPYAGQENHVLGEPQRIGVMGKGFSWIDDWNTRPRYQDETIVTKSYAENSMEGLEMELESCVHCSEDTFLRKITVKNREKIEREVELFFLQDLQLYGNGIGDTAFFSPDQNGIVHYKRNRYFVANVKKEDGSCSDFNQYGVYNGDPEPLINAGDLNDNPIAQGDVKSAISIELELEPKGEQTFYYWITAAKGLDALNQKNNEIKPEIAEYFDETVMCWRGHLGKLDCDTSQLTDHVEDQLKRSILVITGQSNENGAITAANDSENLNFNQDKYGYLWPRDGAFVAETMAEAGYEEFAENFFDFVENVIEEEGYLLHKYNPDGSLGSSWHPWVDENNDKQLPIQEDETALILWTLKRYYEITGDKDLLEEKYSPIVKPAADFIYEYFDEELKLPEPSHDLWEERRYISSFTVATVYAGLKAAAEIAELLDENGEKWLDRAEEIKKEGLEKLRSEEKKRYGRGIVDGELDESVSAPLIFLEKLGLVDENDEYYQNTVDAIEYDLSPDTEIGGIARYRGDHYHNVTDDFNRVPGNPWIICTLWLAQQKIMEASSEEELEEAKELMHWTCENSLETGLLPEQVDPFTGEGKSVAPLTWSHSTFIETTLRYLEKKEELS